MKLKSIFIIASFSMGTVLSAQGDDYVLDKDSIKVKDRLHYNFTMGAGFGYSSNAGDFFSTYYSPSVTYDVSERFILRSGLTYVNTRVDNYPIYSDYSYSLFNGNISQYYAYIEGVYKVNDRLNVGGSVFYDFSQYQDVNGNLYGAQNALDNIGYSGFFEYKISDGMSIIGEVRVNDRSPLGNRFMGAAEHSFFGR